MLEADACFHIWVVTKTTLLVALLAAYSTQTSSCNQQQSAKVFAFSQSQSKILCIVCFYSYNLWHFFFFNMPIPPLWYVVFWLLGLLLFPHWNVYYIVKVKHRALLLVLIKVHSTFSKDSRWIGQNKIVHFKIETLTLTYLFCSLWQNKACASATCLRLFNGAKLTCHFLKVWYWHRVFPVYDSQATIA